MFLGLKFDTDWLEEANRPFDEAKKLEVDLKSSATLASFKPKVETEAKAGADDATKEEEPK